MSEPVTGLLFGPKQLHDKLIFLTKTDVRAIQNRNKSTIARKNPGSSNLPPKIIQRAMITSLESKNNAVGLIYLYSRIPKASIARRKCLRSNALLILEMRKVRAIVTLQKTSIYDNAISKAISNLIIKNVKKQKQKSAKIESMQSSMISLQVVVSRKKAIVKNVNTANETSKT